MCAGFSDSARTEMVGDHSVSLQPTNADSVPIGTRNFDVFPVQRWLPRALSAIRTSSGDPVSIQHGQT